MAHRALIFAALLGAAGNAAAQQHAPQLTRIIEYDNPAWRPDSRALVFESTLEGSFSIYVIDPGGTGLRRLTTDSANNEQPRWSPDGKRVVFSSDRAGHLDLYLMNADGSGQTRLTTTPGGGYYQASFSPDGQWVAFQGRPDNRETCDRLYVVASDGSGFRQLTDSTYGAEGPEWSRDGRTITFLRVPYPRLRWEEIRPGDLDLARAGARRMSIRPDGSHLEPAAPLPTTDTLHSNSSPDGRHAAYTRTDDGWPGLYVYDRATRTERRIAGGPSAGPLGYLRSAALTELTDTFDTYLSTHGGPIEHERENFVVRVVRRVGGRRFELSDTWFDSSGKETARQTVRTGRGTVATELEMVRASDDSASMLVLPDRVTGWVVPQGESPRLFDGAAAGERYTRTVVMSAIAKARPAISALFLAPVSTLYGPNPIQTQVDSIRVVRRDSLLLGQATLPVLVLERANGGQTWVDEATGAEVLSRGNAGPTRWWWHIRRGVTPPSAGQ
jgi:dipeptidyl aminopeptidase/acylaminoacyl peptidase